MINQLQAKKKERDWTATSHFLYYAEKYQCELCIRHPQNVWKEIQKLSNVEMAQQIIFVFFYLKIFYFLFSSVLVKNK